MANENLNSKTDVVPILNQILSTFKFTESAIACTKDAKMCPDGSYVGRTGPNCEFLCPGDAKIDSCIKGGEIYQSPAVLGKKRGECCSGLGVIAQAATDDCELFSQMGGGNSICSNCGNNVCESWENKCTCPEDCKK